MGFVIAFCFLAYIVVMFWSAFRCADSKGWVNGLVSFIMLGVLFGGLLTMAFKENERGPCVQYETQMHFNAATKTTMPARVCVLRGEWVDEGGK